MAGRAREFILYNLKWRHVWGGGDDAAEEFPPGVFLFLGWKESARSGSYMSCTSPRRSSSVDTDSADSSAKTASQRETEFAYPTGV